MACFSHSQSLLCSLRLLLRRLRKKAEKLLLHLQKKLLLLLKRLHLLLRQRHLYLKKLLHLANEEEDPAEAKRRAFRTLVEGEYKEQYAELFQNAFNRRFREMKGMESRLAAQQGVLELLSRRYNTPEGDLGKLRAAIENLQNL